MLLLYGLSSPSSSYLNCYQYKKSKCKSTEEQIDKYNLTRIEKHYNHTTTNMYHKQRAHITKRLLLFQYETNDALTLKSAMVWTPFKCSVLLVLLVDVEMLLLINVNTQRIVNKEAPAVLRPVVHVTSIAPSNNVNI